jgi:hypothetical protein
MDPAELELANEVLLKLESEVKRLRRESKRLLWCSFCGAGYSRHFSNCPCERIPTFVAELRLLIPPTTVT